jgi:hypothetical protein
MAQFETTDHFYMPTSTGDAEWHRVVSLLEELPGASIEVGVHPGDLEPWRRRERESLGAFAAAARERGHELVNWTSVLAT